MHGAFDRFVRRDRRHIKLEGLLSLVAGSGSDCHTESVPLLGRKEEIPPGQMGHPCMAPGSKAACSVPGRSEQLPEL